MKKKLNLTKKTLTIFLTAFVVMGYLPFAHPQDATRSRPGVTQDGDGGNPPQNLSTEGRISGVETPSGSEGGGIS
ncbi:MAG: hypothetical protein U1F66_11645 [bacterium]